MYKKFEDFLKKYKLYDQEVIDYIKTRMIIVDYSYEPARDYIGCFPIVKNGMITDIRLCVPKMVDDITVSINIHEYVHLLDVYKRLYEEDVKDKNEELLPVLCEFKYLEDNDTEYLDYYKECIMNGKNRNLKRLVLSYDDNKKRVQL